MFPFYIDNRKIFTFCSKGVPRKFTIHTIYTKFQGSPKSGEHVYNGQPKCCIVTTSVRKCKKYQSLILTQPAIPSPTSKFSTREKAQFTCFGLVALVIVFINFTTWHALALHFFTLSLKSWNRKGIHYPPKGLQQAKCPHCYDTQNRQSTTSFSPMHHFEWMRIFTTLLTIDFSSPKFSNTIMS